MAHTMYMYYTQNEKCSQWQIQDYPEGATTPKGCANLLYGTFDPPVVHIKNVSFKLLIVLRIDFSLCCMMLTSLVSGPCKQLNFSVSFVHVSVSVSSEALLE